MSGVVDVNEPFEVVFTAPPGSTVAATWMDPDQVEVFDTVQVLESPPGSGKYPRTFVPTSVGVWTAWFFGVGSGQRYHIRAIPVTGPPPFAVVADVGNQYGALTPAQEGLVGHLLRAASALLRHHAPGVDVDVRQGRIGPEVAALTVVNMVLRVLRNPEGLRAKTTGPFARTFDTTAAAGLLVVTEYDLAAVTPTPGAVPLPAGTAGLGFGTIRVRPTMTPPVYGTVPWAGHGG